MALPEYPFTNMSDTNLNWLISTVKALEKKVNDLLQGAIEKAIDEYFNKVMIDAIYDADTETIILSKEVAVEDGIHIYTADNNRMIISDGSVPIGGDD